MRASIAPFSPCGTIAAIASKSDVHRLLIGAALSNGETKIQCATVSEDISATANCLNALCADILRVPGGFMVLPKNTPTAACTLDCFESGSTFRFLLPLACALGRTARFNLRGRLPERPIEPLWTLLLEHGAQLSGKGTTTVSVEGQLKNGLFDLPGNISSQYVSGLLFALPLLKGDSKITLTSPLQSRPYVDMTLDVLSRFGIKIETGENVYFVPGEQVYRSPKCAAAEGDWSNAAFFLCAAAVRGSVTISGLSLLSAQGDRSVGALLKRFGADVTEKETGVTVKSGALSGLNIDALKIPDLVPALCVVAAAASGVTRIVNAERLKLKESDRLFTVVRTLSALGADIEEDGGGLVIRGTGALRGGTIDSHGDHRIAMAAACAAVLCEEPVIIENAQAVNKSYPTFFEELAALGAPVTKEETL